MSAALGLLFRAMPKDLVKELLGTIVLEERTVMLLSFTGCSRESIVDVQGQYSCSLARLDVTHILERKGHGG